ncbi:MAG: hypothetical protein V1775_17385 [Bacteroidota bacterium]
MMLSDDFYKIEKMDQTDSHISAIINLNHEHRVYQGHFPGVPVVPGVCQVQIVKEVLCFCLNNSYLLSESRICKFINMMNPMDVSHLKCEISWSVSSQDDISFSGELSDENLTYLKIKGTLIKENG